MNSKINTKADLEEFVTCNWKAINNYLDGQFKDKVIPLYSSVDIREGKNKFAPVDHNIYPAGFNNLCQLDRDAAGEVFIEAIRRNAGGSNVSKVCIIPESNTKNTYYLDNLIYLAKIFIEEGFDITFASFDESLFSGESIVRLESFSKFPLEIYRATIKDNLLYVNDHAQDFIILNNDQSSPIEINWKDLKTPVAPSPFIGWNKRQKVKHFCYYKKVLDQFCSEFSINPDLLQAKFKAVEELDFSSKVGFEQLASSVDELVAELPEDTNVFVKASQGTYGMGIMVVKSGAEVLSMNRKARNKMDIGKNKIKFTTALVQEGVESILKYDDLPSEVAIYLADGQPIGGFVRANKEKGADSNLNSRGMVFKKYCISEIRENNEAQSKEAVYSVIARLATLASSYEIEEIIYNKEGC
jgi:glutamate--cysteine ligase